MISHNLVARGGFALLPLDPDTVDSHSTSSRPKALLCHLLTTRHPADGHWFEPGRVIWKQKQNLTFWPLIPGGPGKPMGPGSPCTTKKPKITVFHKNTTQAYTHIGLHIFSAFLDIWYEEVADVDLMGTIFFFFFFYRKKTQKATVPQLQPPGATCMLLPHTTQPNHGWNRLSSQPHNIYF